MMIIRFGDLRFSLIETIQHVNELTLLKTLLKKAVAVESVAVFEEFMVKQEPSDDSIMT